jgi:hypothetical protein
LETNSGKGILIDDQEDNDNHGVSGAFALRKQKLCYHHTFRWSLPDADALAASVGSAASSQIRLVPKVMRLAVGFG